jgi:hypothetical protein
MTIEYTWEISQLEGPKSQDGLQDVVTTVHWRLNADDGQGHTASRYGTADMGAVDPAQFTPFADLTQQQVIVWVENALGAPEVEAIKTRLANDIAEQINPPTFSKPAPWAA